MKYVYVYNGWLCTSQFMSNDLNTVGQVSVNVIC